MVNVGENLVESLTSGIASRRQFVSKAAISMISAMINDMKRKESLFRNVGNAYAKALAEGIVKRKTTVVSGITAVISSALRIAKNYYSSFNSAGSYLAEGFADGISSGSFAAVTAAAAMANAAKEAAEAALGIQSPSKEFYAIGRFAGMGLVNALNDYGRNSYKAGAEVASQAKKGLGDAIGRISDLIDSDMDSQPVIRPVLDLSDIQSGAGTINGLFGMTPSVGVMSNVRAINTMMNRNQNGGSAEIVSAINKLRGDLGNIGGDTYQINGITYGADSEISSAIQTLVRAAMVERRI